MQWKQVAVILILVGGALGATYLGAKELALVLAGAGAGFATNHNTSVSRRDDHSSRPPKPS